MSVKQECCYGQEVLVSTHEGGKGEVACLYTFTSSSTDARFSGSLTKHLDTKSRTSGEALLGSVKLGGGCCKSDIRNIACVIDTEEKVSILRRD